MYRLIKATGERRGICRFGILSGRTCNEFEIFDNDNVYPSVTGFEDGDQVIAVVNVTVNDKGQMRCWLNEIGECPDGLREELIAHVRNGKAAKAK